VLVVHDCWRRHDDCLDIGSRQQCVDALFQVTRSISIRNQPGAMIRIHGRRREMRPGDSAAQRLRVKRPNPA
jgi:hypothetical protein